MVGCKVYGAKRAARAWHDTSTTGHDTTGDGGAAMPCRVGSPCPTVGQGTTLRRLSHAMPARQSRRHAELLRPWWARHAATLHYGRHV